MAGPYASALVGGAGIVDGIFDARDILKGKELDCLRERQLEKEPSKNSLEPKGGSQ